MSISYALTSLLVFILAGCSANMDVTTVNNGGGLSNVDFGNGTNILGRISRGNSSTLALDNCDNPASVLLIEADALLSANDNISSVAQTMTDNAGAFAFNDLQTLNFDPNRSYFLLTTVCEQTLVRLVTGGRSQTISPASTMISYGSLYGRSNEFAQGISRESRLKIAHAIEALADEQDLFNSLIANEVLSAEFQNLFAIHPDQLKEVPPLILKIEMPRKLSEGVATPLSVVSSHWDSSYESAYLWRVGEKVVSNTAFYNFSPTGNMQGEHSLQLSVGRKMSDGNLDTSLPTRVRVATINVDNTLPAISPQFSVTSQITDTIMPVVIHKDDIKLRIKTGDHIGACDTFSALTVTESPEQPVQKIENFPLKCQTNGWQQENFILKDELSGPRKLYLWAIDEAGNISEKPAQAEFIYMPSPIIATATGIPTAASPLTQLSVTVGGDFVDSFTYKIGSGHIECRDSAGYSAREFVTQPLVLNLNNLMDGTIKFCVLGTNKWNVWQDIEQPSQFLWVKDTTPPTAILVNVPPATNNSTSISVVVNSQDVASYRYKIGPVASIDCSQSLDYSAPIAVANPISADISSEVDGAMILCVVGKDLAGNWQSWESATTAVWQKDTSRPTVLLTSPISAITNISPLPFTATFSKGVVGFSSGDLNIVNGTISNFSGSGSTYTFDVIPSADGAVVVSIGDSIASDSYGNLNVSGNLVQKIHDSTAPEPGVGGVLAVVSVGQYSVDLAWNSASDNLSAPNLLEYEARISTAANMGTIDQAELNASVFASYAPNMFSAAATELVAGTTYYVGVIVRDVVGNKAFYGPLAFTTLPNNPPELDAVSTQTITAGEILNLQFTDHGQTQDVDGHPLLFTCTFFRGPFEQAGDDCVSSLPGTANFNSSTGELSWATNSSTSTGGYQEEFNFKISASDQYIVPLIDELTFKVIVNPPLPLQDITFDTPTWGELMAYDNVGSTISQSTSAAKAWDGGMGLRASIISGSTGYVATNSFAPTDRLALSLWLRVASGFNSVAGDEVVVLRAGPDFKLFLKHVDTGSVGWQLALRNESGGVTSCPIALQPDSWSLVTISTYLNSSAGYRRIWLDGIACADDSNLINTGTISAVDRLGATEASPGLSLTYDIEDLRIGQSFESVQPPSMLITFDVPNWGEFSLSPNPSIMTQDSAAAKMGSAGMRFNSMSNTNGTYARTQTFGSQQSIYVGMWLKVNGNFIVPDAGSPYTSITRSGIGRPDFWFRYYVGTVDSMSFMWHNAVGNNRIDSFPLDRWIYVIYGTRHAYNDAYGHRRVLIDGQVVANTQNLGNNGQATTPYNLLLGPANTTANGASSRLQMTYDLDEMKIGPTLDSVRPTSIP